jgi:structure-specific recognition protein 1
MRGQKYDYKIKYDDISRLFLLPKPDDVHMAFVISLDKPIRQGQQRYQHLVLQTNKDQDEVTVNLDEETLQKEYGGDLQPVMKGSLSSLIAKTFKVIAKKKVFVPGKFMNANQQSCIKCALRANEGLLYPLEKQLLFIHKPPVLIRFNEVESIEFQRYAGGQGSTRNFDLCVTLKASAVAGGGQAEYIFSGIDRSDYSSMYSFFNGKNVKIINISESFPGAVEDEAPVYNEDEIYGGPDDGELDEESEDEDYDADAAAQDQEDEADSDASDEDMDSDDFGSEIDDDLDSDLEEARGGGGKQKKKKPVDSEDEDEDESPKKKKGKRKPDGGDQAGKKKRAKKDPNAPKKPLSTYMLYMQENRAKIKEENPGADFGELGKLVGQAYKNISAEERARLDKKAAQDKKRYAAELANYKPPTSSGDKSEKNPAKAKKTKDKAAAAPATKKAKKAAPRPRDDDEDDSDGIDDDDLHLEDDSDDDDE